MTCRTQRPQPHQKQARNFTKQHTKTVAHWGFKRGQSEEETPENNTERVFCGSVFICMEGGATLRSSPLQKPASINYALDILPSTEQWHYWMYFIPPYKLHNRLIGIIKSTQRYSQHGLRRLSHLDLVPG